jgi:hypothetical protein
MALGLVNTAHLSVLPKRAVGVQTPPSPHLHYAPFHEQLQYLKYQHWDNFFSSLGTKVLQKLWALVLGPG